ncbi:MAG: GNAT family N-acetyltransferase [Aggregatilineales bacterium]|nr:GNAT family N-acetyltransferase [Aggregatilineales bacterium]HQE18037.1 GNAT family N-acetyltransferase [Aggregatilineales bacterium]
MTENDIRRVSGEQLLQDTYFLLNYAFQPSPPLPNREEWEATYRQYDESITFVAYQNGMPVATASSAPMTHNIRGCIFPMGGVWGVATHPGARRQGHALRVTRAVLEAVRDAGNAFTCLYAFRESFYERIGYVMWPQAQKVRFPTQALAPVLRMELNGRVELLSIKEGFDIYRDFLRAIQPEVHGMALMTDRAAGNLRRRNALWLAVARDGQGSVTGVMTYSLKPGGRLKVMRFYTSSIEARYLLLNWLARHIDHATEVEIQLPRDEQPEMWLPDLRVKSASLEPPLSRVLDVERMGGVPVGEGAFTARLVDRFCPWNEGVWRFEAVEGRLHVTRAAAADFEMTIQALSSLVYGIRDPQEFRFHGWGEPPQDVQAIMRRMFPVRTPWHHEVY